MFRQGEGGLVKEHLWWGWAGARPAFSGMVTSTGWTYCGLCQESNQCVPMGTWKKGVWGPCHPGWSGGWLLPSLCGWTRRSSRFLCPLCTNFGSSFIKIILSNMKYLVQWFSKCGQGSWRSLRHFHWVHEVKSIFVILKCHLPFSLCWHLHWGCKSNGGENC